MNWRPEGMVLYQHILRSIPYQISRSLVVERFVICCVNAQTRCLQVKKERKTVN